MATINVLDATGSTQALEKPNANGQNTMANSRPVVIASNQSTINVAIPGTLPAFAATPAFTISGTLPAFAATPAFTISGTLPAFAATPTFNLGGAIPAGANAIGSVTIGGTLPAFAATPAFTISGTLPAFAATPTFNLGTLNGAALDTTLTAMSAKLPAALGQVTRANSMSVTIASDQTDVPVAMNDIVAATNITTQNLAPAGAATAGSAGAITPAGRAGLTIQVTGTYTGALSLQGTVDGTNWITIGGTPLVNVATGVAAATIASATQGIFQAECSGFAQMRVTALAAVTGTAAVTLRASEMTSTLGISDALPAGTNSIGTVVIGSGTVTALTTLTTLANGQTAHSAASTGSPVRVAGRVNTAVDTTLVAGDASDLFITTSGALVEKPFSVPELDWQATSGLTPLAVATSTLVRAAGAAGVRNYVTAIQLVNNSATVSTTVSILDGATVLWTGFLPATTAALQVVPVMVYFPTPLRGTAATAVNIQLGTTAASVFWNAQGYQAA